MASNYFGPQARKPLGQWYVLKSLGANPRPKFPFDHMNAHRQQNRKIQYPGVVQLVARVVWEHNVQRSSLPILIFIILLHCLLLLSLNIQNWRGDRYAGIRACFRIETYSGPLRKGSRG